MTRRYSHPAVGEREAVALRDHLSDVASRAVSAELIPKEKETSYGSRIREIVERLGWIHDIGKATTWFQQYIDLEPGDPSGHPTHHAPLGALLGYYVLDVSGHDPEECLAGFVAVAKHHGALPNVAEYVYEATDWHSNPGRNSRQREVLQQVEDIDADVPALADEIVDEATDGQGSWETAVDRITDKTLFDDVKENVVPEYGFDHSTRAISEEFYSTLLQCWGGLVVADKTSAAHVPTAAYEASYPSRSTLKSYIDGLGGEASSEREQSLNERRRAARQDVLESIDQFVTNESSNVATLTLPTGLGKTLTGLDAALAIRDETERKRIVYGLPFTSIVDQVASEVESIFDAPPTGRTLTVHHHLAETVTRLESEDESTDERAGFEEMLGESWRSGLVVTTFVQLLESLVGPANSQSLKLPALYDSVIVLDEPQGIPHDWWTLVRRLGTLLAEDYDATVIAMTATQPEIFGDEAPELVSNGDRYFDDIDRVEYVFDESVASYPEGVGDEPISLETAADRLEERVQDDGSVLSVCNTVESARKLTRELEEQLTGVDIGEVYTQMLETGGVPSANELADAVCDRDGGPVLGHLTTRLRPVDRLTIIEAIKQLRQREVPLAVVSTQLIEAGVDVSFDYVFRDLAPLDSIVQAAGRCNRSFERERGTVTVWWLDASDGQETTPADAVYEQWGDSLLSETAGVLKSEGILGEWGVEEPVREARVSKDAVETYYENLSAERNVGKQEYVDYLDEAECEEAGALSLIDQKRAVDVVVCRTQEERDKIEEIKDAWERVEYDRLRTLIDETKTAQVSIQVYDDEAMATVQNLSRLHDESELRWTAPDQPEFSSWFDSTEGLAVPDSTVEGRFL